MAKKVKSSAKASTVRTAPAAEKAGSEAFEWKAKRLPLSICPTKAAKEVSLRELTAQGNVVLYFYPKDMTPGCTTEACSFRDNISGLRELGAEVVGISGIRPPRIRNSSTSTRSTSRS